MTGPALDAADHAQLALLLEVAGTPKPGNVDRARDHPELRFEQFLAGAVGAGPALRAVPEPPLGARFERAVAGMAGAAGTNTQFGCLLLLVPLAYADAAGEGPVTRERARAVARSTTVEDACGFYRAFDHVDVAVDDPPAGMADLDVRRGGDATPALRERGLTLYDVMERSTDRDGLAREWTGGFERTFRAADWLLADEGAAGDRAARAFLRLLAAEEDTFVATTSGPEVAREATERARAVLEGEAEVDADGLAAEFVDRGINPGTTADITAGALFVALRRGLAP
jgi:triphosphoribosyl-dephospho-CoA synthase